MRAETWLRLESIHMTALAAFDAALERSAQIIEFPEIQETGAPCQGKTPVSRVTGDSSDGND